MGFHPQRPREGSRGVERGAAPQAPPRLGPDGAGRRSACQGLLLHRQASAGQATENQLTAGAKDPPFHEEHRMPESLRRLQSRGEPRGSSRMGSAFPGVYCPGQRTREPPGRQPAWGPSGRRPRGTALPWTLYEGHRWGAWLVWFVQNPAVRGGGDVAVPTDNA